MTEPLRLSDLEGASTFSTINVTRDDLLEAIIENKKTHDEIFASALDGYYVSVRKELENKLRLIPLVQEEFQAALESVNPESGKPVQLEIKNQYALFNLNVPFPVSHEDDYKRAIKMVQLSASHIFKLTASEFAQYVMNEWNWKQQFLATNAQYCTGIAPTAALRKMAG